jgi:hypothetical protein
MSGANMTALLSDHVKYDLRSREMHRLIANKIRNQPELFQIAIDNVERWKELSSGHVPFYLEEWRKILGHGVEFSLSFVTESSPEADRLLQSTPFAGVLSPKERWEFLRKWKESTLIT